MKMKKLLILAVVLLALLAVWQVNLVSAGGGGCGPGTGTPGYWKNHPEAWPHLDVWPDDWITIGGQDYTKERAIEFLGTPVKGDKCYTMFKALVAAKLNLAAGNRTYCVKKTIHDADHWMKCNGCLVDGEVKANSPAWQKEGECLYEVLDAYNNGDLFCAPSRDDLE
jgi:hypothetical protein